MGNESVSRADDAPADGTCGTSASSARHAAPDPVEPGTINGMPWGKYLEQEYAIPRRIALIELEVGGTYCGLIAPASSGYLWRQQTSGLLCTQREMEGIYLPLPDPVLAQNLVRLDAGCCMDTRDDREADAAYRAAHREQVAAAEALLRERHPELAALRAAYAAEDRPLGLTTHEADAIDLLLREAHLPLSVARERLERSTEAWVWVRVASDVASWPREFSPSSDSAGRSGSAWVHTGYRCQPLLAALSGTMVILTWTNCD